MFFSPNFSYIEHISTLLKSATIGEMHLSMFPSRVMWGRGSGGSGGGD